MALHNAGERAWWFCGGERAPGRPQCFTPSSWGLWLLAPQLCSDSLL